MKDGILDFIEDHKIVCVAVVLLIVGVIAMFVIRNNNLKKKEAEEAAALIAAQRAEQEQAAMEAQAEADRIAAEEAAKPPKFDSNLGLGANDGNGRVNIVDPVEESQEPVKRRTPRYPVYVNVFDHTAVPKRNMDGSSCKAYFDSVSIADFDTYWGTELTQEDFFGNARYYVGVEEEDFSTVNSLESTGWLSNHLRKMEPNDVIQFTNLHVIGSLSTTHVALLCSYDWYSVFGMKDTLVVFEDISGTLDPRDFQDGDIFAATIFVHNIKVMDDVNGQRVIVCEYAVYDDSLYE